MLMKAAAQLILSSKQTSIPIATCSREIMPTPISEIQLAPENKICENILKILLFFGEGFSFCHVREWQTNRASKSSTLSSLSREAASCSLFSLLILTRLFPFQLPVLTFFLMLFQPSSGVPAKYNSLPFPRTLLQASTIP